MTYSTRGYHIVPFDYHLENKAYSVGLSLKYSHKSSAGTDWHERSLLVNMLTAKNWPVWDPDSGQTWIKKQR